MFIPIGDDNSQRHLTPYIVYLLLALNAFVWYLQLSLGEKFSAGFSAVPLEIVKGVDLTRTTYATLEGQRFAIPHAPGPHPLYLTIFSSMFMHASWMHIFGNMLYLMIFGDQIEDRLGHFRFLLFYLACGVAAAVAQIATDPSSIIPCVGASGAIAGVLGAYLILHPRNRIRVLIFRSIVYMPAVFVLGMWGVMQLVGHVGSAAGQHTGVAYMAHIGGFAVGFVVSIFLRR